MLYGRAISVIVAGTKVILNDVSDLLPDYLRRYGMATFSLITPKGTRSFAVTVPGKFNSLWGRPFHGRRI